MSKASTQVTEEVEDLRSLSSEMAGHLSAIFVAIEVLSDRENRQDTVRNLASCGKYIIESMSGSIHSFCSGIKEISKELH